MNAYYENNNIARSNTRIYPQAQTGDRLISFICMIVAALTSSVAIKIEKCAVCIVGFFAFFGIVGSMEAGSISILYGLLLCAAVSLVEFLVLRSLVKKNRV